MSEFKREELAEICNGLRDIRNEITKMRIDNLIRFGIEEGSREKNRTDRPYSVMADTERVFEEYINHYIKEEVAKEDAKIAVNSCNK
jgi:hypothetical protein